MGIYHYGVVRALVEQVRATQTCSYGQPPRLPASMALLARTHARACASSGCGGARDAAQPGSGQDLTTWQLRHDSLGARRLVRARALSRARLHHTQLSALLRLRRRPQGAIPRVISGTSAGSVVAAFLAVRTDEEVAAELRALGHLYREQGSDGPLHGSHWWKLRKLLRDGVLYTVPDFKSHLGWFTRGLTFREAFLRTGRVVSITCTPHKRLAGSSPPLSARGRGRDACLPACCSACLRASARSRLRVARNAACDAVRAVARDHRLSLSLSPRPYGAHPRPRARRVSQSSTTSRRRT
jgi:hypothetical protein